MFSRQVTISLLTRILISISTRTFFQPDEYFQSLEPAHHLVFGYGHLTWEWSTPKPIRSFLYPAINVPVYWFLKASGLVDVGIIGDWLLIILPKLVHGIFAAATDIWLCELARVVLGNDYVSTALLLSLTSFFHALALSRSLSNSMETSLCTIAFAYYPWDASSKTSPQLLFNRSRIRKTLIFSALACMVRPTNAVIWVFLYGKLLWASRNYSQILFAIIKQAISIGFVALFSLFTLDSIYYGKPTFTPLNFFLTNLSSVSLFYGSNPWHYYLTQALPIICTTALPFTLHGIWSVLFRQDEGRGKIIALKTMFGAIAWTIGVYSLAGHKEWRFIHPLLPLLHIFAASSLVDLSRHNSQTKKPTKSPPSNKGHKHLRSHPQTHTGMLGFNLDLPPIHQKYFTLILITLPVSLYIILFYCSAPISVLTYLRSLPREELQSGGIGVLMPCHSIPGHAYLHREELLGGRLWSLGCEPPLFLSSSSAKVRGADEYRDQTDVFFADPIKYITYRFPKTVDPKFPLSPFPASLPGQVQLGQELWLHEWPLYLMFFGDLVRNDTVRGLFIEKGYREVWKRGREWEGEGKRKGGVRVWKWYQ